MHLVKKLVIVAVIGAIAVAARIGSVSHRRAVAVREYESQGFQMVEGCNGGAAVQADGQVFMIKRYLDEFGDSSAEDTNMVAHLQRALVVAQEKARVLSEDCRRRGHCDTYPWTTNWTVIQQALTAFEKSN